MLIHPPAFASGEPVRLASDDPDATVWQAGEHTPQVVMQRLGEWCWVEVDGVASYRFPADSADGSVRCDAYLSGASPDVVTDLYYRTIVPLALQTYGLESMHGTALEHDGGAVLLCAPSRTGKSTLAHALSAHGWPLLADDGLVWEVSDEPQAGAYLHPIPFSLMLREPSSVSGRSVVERRDHEQLVEARDHDQQPAATGPVPVRAVLLLERSGETAPAAERLGKREAFTRLLAPSYAMSLADKSRKGRMMAAYLQFVRAVPVFALRYPSGLDRLPEVVDFVQGLVAQFPEQSSGQGSVKGAGQSSGQSVGGAGVQAGCDAGRHAAEGNRRD